MAGSCELGRRRFHALRSLCFATAALASAAVATAGVLSENLTRPEDGTEAIFGGRWVAGSFTTGEGTYFVKSVTLRMGRGKALPADLEVQIYSDENGQPHTAIGSLQSPYAFSLVPSDAEFRSALSMQSFEMSGQDFRVKGSMPSGLLLGPNRNYWAVAKSHGGDFFWAYTTNNSGEGDGFLRPYATSTNGGSTWATSGIRPMIMQVETIQFLVDYSAIASTVDSGLPMAMVQRELTLGVVDAATRDVNSRLFRLRAGIDPANEPVAPVAENLGCRYDCKKACPRDGKQVAPGKDYKAARLSPERWEIFAAGNFGSLDREASSPLTGFGSTILAGTVGGEFRATQNLTLGVALTGIKSEHKIGHGVGQTDADGFSLAAYASWVAGGFYADALYSFTQLDHKIRRDTGADHTATAQPSSSSQSIQFNTGYNFRILGITTGPVAGIDYVNAELGGYYEQNGGTADLKVPGQNFDSLVSRAGWQVSIPVDVKIADAVFQFRGIWGHEFRNRSEWVDVEMRDSPFVLVDGGDVSRVGSFAAAARTTAPDEDYIDLGAGLLLRFSDTISLVLDYDARLFQAGSASHYASITGSIRF